MSVPAALAEDYRCYCFSGNHVQRAYIIKDDSVIEDFELSGRKVLGKGWILCDEHPPVEMDRSVGMAVATWGWRSL